VVPLVRRRPYGKIAGGERLAPCRKSPRKTWRRETTGNRDQQERTLKGCGLFVYAPGHDSPARSVGIVPRCPLSVERFHGQRRTDNGQRRKLRRVCACQVLQLALEDRIYGRPFLLRQRD